ncbi:MAG: hypothetical protein IRZ21_12795, partial [Thermoleophilaceae bacterium]|nr:hypothetical protein [Thermoleophilaceae bacterium]
LSPHKLFRRAFLEEHGIRFPEGRRRLEDHVFVMRAYLHQPRISVLADYPVYHWVLRDPAKNASAGGFDAAGYYGNVREVLDLVVEHTEPGELRERLLAHWYRGKMLGRVGGRYFLRRDPEFRRELVSEVRSLAQERYGPWVDRLLAFSLRLRSHLLLHGSYAQLEALAELEQAIRARARIAEARRHLGDVRVRAEARLVARGEPLRFERRGERLLWAPPEPLRGAFPEELLDATDDLSGARAEVFVRRQGEGVEYPVTTHCELRLDPLGADGREVEPVLVLWAAIAGSRGAAGSPLEPGRWEALAEVRIAGFSANARLRRQPGGEPLVVDVDARGLVREHLEPGARQRRPLAARALRRARAAARAASGR